MQHVIVATHPWCTCGIRVADPDLTAKNKNKGTFFSAIRVCSRHSRNSIGMGSRRSKMKRCLSNNLLLRHGSWDCFPVEHPNASGCPGLWHLLLLWWLRDQSHMARPNLLLCRTPAAFRVLSRRTTLNPLYGCFQRASNCVC